MTINSVVLYNATKFNLLQNILKREKCNSKSMQLQTTCTLLLYTFSVKISKKKLHKNG